MRHFLSHHSAKPSIGAPFRSSDCSVPRAARSAMSTEMQVCGLGLSLLALVVLLSSSSLAQVAIPTSRADNSRTNANTNETMLTPSNVNKNSFGHLFSAPVDYVVMAQPLYIPNVNIPGQGTHNVVYVVTQADSVYAIDADNGAQLWYASMLSNVGAGATTASGKYLPCGTAPGFNQEGIVGTPVIDPNTNTMYLVAKSLLGTTVRHHLHALDITTGNEQANSPVLIQATSISTATNHKTVFNSLHQKNRPGLLLLNGIVYLGFGSNYCNDDNSGWVLSYNATSLSQVGIFNTSPDNGLTSIWQAGSGIAADEAGNIFVETAESGNNGYDVQNGGQTYCNSVLKLNPNLVDVINYQNVQYNQYEVADYFTPWSVGFLNSNDLDLSSTGALVLPDQPGATPHELIAGGKEGFIYVLNRDSMGGYSVGSDSQIIQELALLPGEVANQTVKDVLFGSPAYWNNTVYFAPNAAPLMAFPLSGGLLGTPLKTPAIYSGSHSPSISANGNTSGIMWVISSGLNAFDAVSLKLLYNTNQAAGARDKLGTVGHFVTQTVANGKVYVTDEPQTTPTPTYALEAYGLYYSISVTGGGGQTAPVTTALPAPLQVNVSNPYSGQPIVGATVTFSDGCTKAGAATCGSFNPASAVTDSNGNASTSYTMAQKAGTYSLTSTLVVNNTPASSTTVTATATAGNAARFIAYGGSNQTGTDGFSIANPIIAQVEDAYKNPVPGVTINFAATKGAIPNPASAPTDPLGMARTYLQLPNTPSTITVTATAPNNTNPPLTPNKETYVEHSVAAVASKIAVTAGNNQTGADGTQLAQALTVFVTDQYGNPFSGSSVTFTDNGAGGSFSNGSTVVTGTNGTATESYTLPKSASNITIDASAAGISSPAAFTETSVTAVATKISVTGGNNQSGAAGTQLPQALTALVVDQFGNPVSGNSVTFSDNGAGGSFSNGTTVVTGANGTASNSYTLPHTATAISISATATGVSSPASFSETSVAGPGANLAVSGGNGQTAPNGTQLPQALVVLVTDQYGNPVSGVSVGFSDAGGGGTFSSPNPGVTGSNGTVSQFYTLPATGGETVNIYANATGIANPVMFTEYGQ